MTWTYAVIKSLIFFPEGLLKHRPGFFFFRSHSFLLSPALWQILRSDCLQRAFCFPFSQPYLKADSLVTLPSQKGYLAKSALPRNEGWNCVQTFFCLRKMNPLTWVPLTSEPPQCEHLKPSPNNRGYRGIWWERWLSLQKVPINSPVPLNTIDTWEIYLFIRYVCWHVWTLTDLPLQVRGNTPSPGCCH